MLRFQLQCSPFTRIAIVSLMLVGLLLSALPLPVGVVFITGGKFPCMAGKCGCSSAEKCWTSCCCHTPAERIAWAKAHGVEIPAYAKEHVLAAAKEESSAHESVADVHPVKASCCARPATSAPSEKSAPVVSSCCSKKSDPKAAVDAECESPDCKSSEKDVHHLSGARPQLILTIMAVRCRGGASEFTSLPWCINKLIFPSLVGPSDCPTRLISLSMYGEPSPWPPVEPPPRLV